MHALRKRNPADLHVAQGLVPALDDHPLAHAESERPSAVAGRVKLSPVLTEAVQPAYER